MKRPILHGVVYPHHCVLRAALGVLLRHGLSGAGAPGEDVFHLAGVFTKEPDTEIVRAEYAQRRIIKRMRMRNGAAYPLRFGCANFMRRSAARIS